MSRSSVSNLSLKINEETGLTSDTQFDFNRFWHKSYPAQVSPQINLSQSETLVDILRQSTRQYTHKKAFSNFGESLSYVEIDQLSTDFAAFLQNRLGLKKGDRFAIHLPNLLQFPIALFGALKAGLVVVNTNPLYSERELEHQFNDANCRAVLTLAPFAHNIESILHLTQLQHVIVTEVGDLLGLPKRYLFKLGSAYLTYVKGQYKPHHLKNAIPFLTALEEGSNLGFRPVDLTEDDIAFFQYTGGTTGLAKGAMLTHRNMVANMKQICSWIDSALKEGEEVALAALPMYHIFCLTVHAFGLLHLGAENILITNPREIKSLIKVFKNQKITFMTGVNTLFNALLNHHEFTKLNLNSLKLSVAGGMALQTSVAERWRKHTHTPLIEGYGLTEASPVVCVNPANGTDEIGTIGLPLPSTDIALFDDDGHEIPLNNIAKGQLSAIGELCIRGPQVMKGYWNQKEETEKMLAGGWLHTGDLAQVDDRGFIRIVDRKKDMILVSGFNVYPNEVEDVLAMHPDVLEVAVIGVADEKSGEAVKAFVVLREGLPGDQHDPIKTQSLINFARERLAAYKVPRQIEFRKDLPKTNVGKILRRALRTEVKGS